MKAEAIPFDTWARDARRFFAADDVHATIPCTVLDALLAGTTYGEIPPELFRVTDASGTVSSFAVRTPPFPLILALGTEADAAALGRARAEAEARADVSPLSGVTGPDVLARAFATSFAGASARRAETSSAVMILYRVDRLAPPPPAPQGALRATTRADVPRLVALFEAFQRDVGGPVAENVRTLEQAVDEARIVAWDVDGEIVSIAQHSAFTETTARIRLVYTVPEHRGRGYAAVTVAALVERILAAHPCACLFADEANATSNALYQRLGFAAIARHVNIMFA